MIIAEKVAEVSNDEKVLHTLSESEGTDLSALDSADKVELQVLKQRRLLTLRERADKVVSITPDGHEPREARNCNST